MDSVFKFYNHLFLGKSHVIPSYFFSSSTPGGDWGARIVVCVVGNQWIGEAPSRRRLIRWQLGCADGGVCGVVGRR